MRIPEGSKYAKDTPRNPVAILYQKPFVLQDEIRD